MTEPAAALPEGGNPSAPSLVVEDPDAPSIDAVVASFKAKQAAPPPPPEAPAPVEAPPAPAAAPPAEPAKPAETAAPTEAAPVETPAPAVEPAVDPALKARRQQFEREAQIERKRRETEQALKVKQAELAAKETKIQQWEAAMAEAKGNPVKARAIMEREFGVTYADETTYYVQEGRETPEQKIARLEAKLAEVAGAIPKIEQDRIARERQAQEEAARAQAQAQFQTDYNYADRFVRQNAEKYPVLASGLVPDAPMAILNLFNGILKEGLFEPGFDVIQPGTRVPIDKLAQIAETFWQGRYRQVKLPGAQTSEPAKPNGASAASPAGATQRSVKASVTGGLSAVQNQAPPASGDDDYETDREAAIARIVSKPR